MHNKTYTVLHCNLLSFVREDIFFLFVLPHLSQRAMQAIVGHHFVFAVVNIVCVLQIQITTLFSEITGAN